MELDEPDDFDDDDALPSPLGDTDDDYLDTGQDLDSGDIPGGELTPDDVDGRSG